MLEIAEFRYDILDARLVDELQVSKGFLRNEAILDPVRRVSILVRLLHVHTLFDRPETW